MANETNWSANADRKEHERAQRVLNEYKASLPEQKHVKVDDKTVLIFQLQCRKARYKNGLNGIINT